MTDHNTYNVENKKMNIKYCSVCSAEVAAGDAYDEPSVCCGKLMYNKIPGTPWVPK